MTGQQGKSVQYSTVLTTPSSSPSSPNIVDKNCDTGPTELAETVVGTGAAAATRVRLVGTPLGTATAVDKTSGVFASDESRVFVRVDSSRRLSSSSRYCSSPACLTAASTTTPVPVPHAGLCRTVLCEVDIEAAVERYQ